ncbi:MAG: threonine--tRNA ligase [Nanoarchaeota archaeon]|nr:threonine--tRNA ligase [Nanoarchaeota archaeon]
MVNLEVLRHSASHVLAIAVKNLYPDVKLGIGPAIEDGFYYDFDNLKISEGDLDKIEKKMKEIIKKNLKFERIEKTIAEAKKSLKDEPYKLDLLKELKKPIFYKTGDFIDLCSGPHVKTTGEIKAFKLLKLAGAYWRGDSKNKMLTRIYGAAFETKKELDDYLKSLEEAKLRDHRKIGKEMDLFSFSEYGPGFPFWHHKGLFIFNQLIEFWREKHYECGYQEIKTPIILNRELWDKSGHWKLYKENMYVTKIDDKECAIKPMNCPGGMLVYKQKIHSYKELPLRVGELGLVHRHEISGVLSGLFRVRMFTQDDAHIFCTPEQLGDEIIGVVKLTQEMLSVFGFKDYKFTLSVRGKKKKDKYLGSDNEWDWAQDSILKALKKLNLKSETLEGEAKFYGPSLDVQIKDCLGRKWQCATVQLDFNLPKRFNIHYEGKDGKKHIPYILHRVVYGSLERFIGILLEHYAGKLPLWLSPVHARIITVSDSNLKFANEVMGKMREKELRVEIDDRRESIPRKVRDAQIEKIPLMVTVGDKEQKEGKLAVRDYYGKVKFGVGVDAFIKKVAEDIKKKKNSLSCDEF